MSFRVAFDLDGTIADMQAVLRVEAERLFGRPRDADAGRRRRPTQNRASGSRTTAGPTAS